VGGNGLQTLVCSVCGCQESETFMDKHAGKERVCVCTSNPEHALAPLTHKVMRHNHRLRQVPLGFFLFEKEYPLTSSSASYCSVLLWKWDLVSTRGGVRELYSKIVHLQERSLGTERP
jgi:hypothetical protein